MPVRVLRLGHRAARDKRISTHCALVSRALGAESLIYTGQRDSEMEDSVRKVSEQWGGRFRIEHAASWRKVIKDFRGGSAHLTMYGLPIQQKIGEIMKSKNLLVVIGAEKVPMEIYHAADWNIAVTNQPHSEVAALAIFLHEFFQGKNPDFGKAKRRIIPQKAGKRFA
jgi:tRNA (cytidine56-2'-O)-methyltransferase